MEYIILVLLSLFIYGSMFLNFVNKYDELYEEYNKLKDKYKNIPFKRMHINKINIMKSFKKHPPKESKMREKEEYLIQNGEFESTIIVNKRNQLIDGYTSYLLAKKYNIKNVEFIRV